MIMNRCRFCGEPLQREFIDLGVTPRSNAYLTADHLERRELFYPLRALICEQCLLVQLPAFETPEQLFGDYAYFSSFSESWLRHAEKYAHMALARFGLDGNALVMEIASNDGYLLRFFRERGIPVLGVEPAANVAGAAEADGIPTLVRFFGTDTAEYLIREGRRADLLVGNNVLAHVPDLNDFVAGMKRVLKPGGAITMEFPHLVRLIEENQFDTIYHEHFSYFSFYTVQQVFTRHGLTIYDVEELASHGGSLRIFACRSDDPDKSISRAVNDLNRRERSGGYDRVGTYGAFQERARRVKRELLTFLIGAREEGRVVVGYGAPAKGNTLLNYCGVRTDLLDYTVDISPHKQGLFLPGTRIPIHGPERIRETRPDYVLILPWNLRREIMAQLDWIREWGARFVVPIPQLEIL
ncbi:MAG: Methyltransferase domain-containing protein [Candidatus Kentron sp. G]|nr:MAG: Methyltransferase domain-containing protein [Candidatus Kentron sp. G]VFN02516.1 MAG: Methyltransferase domain-containing protein [Candidatus Kentron sp. G]VFN03673.1 MAG: Methyltransferase domain-containing protein [Candidatus Kentron sp. G]